jgi:outer membrane murein-binding lipoprotein Lpp
MHRYVLMDIDERLEALAHSVELLASCHKERRMAELAQDVERVSNVVERVTNVVEQTAADMERVNDNVQPVAANRDWANRHMRLEEFVTDIAESTVGWYVRLKHTSGASATREIGRSSSQVA